MKYTLTGYLKEKKPIVTLGSKGFQKGEIWVEPDGTQYPQTLSFALMRGSLNLVDKIELGAKVSITFEIAGRVWQNRCFNELVVLDLYEIKEEVQESNVDEVDKYYAELSGGSTDTAKTEEIPF